MYTEYLVEYKVFDILLELYIYFIMIEKMSGETIFEMTSKILDRKIQSIRKETNERLEEFKLMGMWDVAEGWIDSQCEREIRVATETYSLQERLAREIKKVYIS